GNGGARFAVRGQRATSHDWIQSGCNRASIRNGGNRGRRDCRRRANEGRQHFGLVAFLGRRPFQVLGAPFRRESLGLNHPGDLVLVLQGGGCQLGEVNGLQLVRLCRLNGGVSLERRLLAGCSGGDNRNADRDNQKAQDSQGRAHGGTFLAWNGIGPRT